MFFLKSSTRRVNLIREGSTKTWILQYAYHRSLNRRQYLALRNFYDVIRSRSLESPESNSIDGSWRGLTFLEWRQVLEIALESLNEKQRKTIELACFQGLLLSEIAEQTRETLPNVRHHYYRGMAWLKKFLQSQNGSDEKLRKSKREVNEDDE